MRSVSVSDHPAQPRSLTLSGRLLFLVPVFLLCLLLAAGFIGYRVAVARAAELPGDLVATWKTELGALSAETSALRSAAERESRAYATRVAALQARVMRMEAVGERLASAASLDAGEFDFNAEPAVGGPVGEESQADESKSELARSLEHLERLMDDRERQLDLMEKLFVNRKLASEVSLAGRPVGKGYVSSVFGRRTDPFRGRGAWHKGVDFAAPAGTEVVAVASGVVVWSGRDRDYGNMVEVRHSDGYTTRYAHNRENLVKAGDIVKKGQAIATVGNTGRSTGSHVHFEVLRAGAQVNPMPYITTRRRG